MLPALTHYGRQAVLAVQSTPRSAQAIDWKPRGFWVSVDEGGHGWAHWCESEGFRLAALKVVHDVVLVPDARILLIPDEAAFDAFAAEYGSSDLPGRSDRCDRIDWPTVADRYQGIVIAPYLWSRRYDGGLWYYGWDCASGCIWDAAAVASISARQIAEAA